jgi:hypothetical protein
MIKLNIVGAQLGDQDRHRAIAGELAEVALGLEHTSIALESPRDQAIRLAVANSNMMRSSDSLQTGTDGSNSLPSANESLSPRLTPN